MEKDQYQLDGFSFQSRGEYERAQKEKETIAYLMANTDTADMKSLLKIYNRSVEKESFQTVIGLEFMLNMRKRLVGSGVVSDEILAPVPVKDRGVIRGKRAVSSAEELNTQAEKYKKALETANTGRTIKNMLIIVLILIIFAMIFITYKSQYSVFTYFTNYKEKMRNELLDEYEQWEAELQHRENQISQKEESRDAEAGKP